LFGIYPIGKAYETSKQNLKKNIFKLTQLINHAWKTNFISIEEEIMLLDKKLQSFININTKKDISSLKMEDYKKKNS